MRVRRQYSMRERDFCLQRENNVIKGQNFKSMRKGCVGRYYFKRVKIYKVQTDDVSYIVSEQTR